MFFNNKNFSSDIHFAANVLSTVLMVICLIAAFSTKASAKGIYADAPNKTLTPGAIGSTDKAEVCDPGYPARVRNVTEATKKKVYKNYQVDKKLCVGGCKIDHLVPLSIGGANDITNLWPHEYGSDHTVFMKTRLEVRLRKEVCHGTLNIQEAQSCIQTDWHQCFNRFYPGVYTK